MKITEWFPVPSLASSVLIWACFARIFALFDTLFWLEAVPFRTSLISLSTKPNCQVTEIEGKQSLVYTSYCWSKTITYCLFNIIPTLLHNNRINRNWHILGFVLGTRNFLSSTQQICLHKSCSLLNVGHVHRCGSPRKTCKSKPGNLYICEQLLVHLLPWSKPNPLDSNPDSTYFKGKMLPKILLGGP